MTKKYINSFSSDFFFIIFITITKQKLPLNALFKEFFSIFLQGDLNLKYGKRKEFYTYHKKYHHTLKKTKDQNCMNLPQVVQEKMTMTLEFSKLKFGTINERRHQLHEVIRLSE